jgi:polyisoprenoid-binding protein YceI
MKKHFWIRSLAVAAAVCLSIPVAASRQAALGLDSPRITLAGNSNVHAWTASTTAVRVTQVKLGPSAAGSTFWDEIVKPGAVEAFEIAIPVATLTSDKDGLDKNMHKALKAAQHPEITFRLARLEAKGKALRATGMLKVAGVEREIAFDLTTLRKDASLAVKGTVDILMTDYGIAPPKAMLGMLKTDPKVTITFDLALTVPLT